MHPYPHSPEITGWLSNTTGILPNKKRKENYVHPLLKKNPRSALDLYIQNNTKLTGFCTDVSLIPSSFLVICNNSFVSSSSDRNGSCKSKSNLSTTFKQKLFNLHQILSIFLQWNEFLRNKNSNVIFREIVCWLYCSKQT